jgi:hypothetical protein
VEANKFSGAMIGFPAAGTPNTPAGRARRSGSVVLGRRAVADRCVRPDRAGHEHCTRVLPEAGRAAIGAAVRATFEGRLSGGRLHSRLHRYSWRPDGRSARTLNREPVSGIEPLTCRLQDGCSAN